MTWVFMPALVVASCIALSSSSSSSSSSARADAEDASARAPGERAALPQAPSTAFYYGSELPRELATAYEQLVVEPAHFPNPEAIAALGALPVAYLSVGEVGPLAQAEIDEAWVISDNPAWSSSVMDLENPAYQNHVFNRFEALYVAGYRAFFLDTLDSFQRVADPERRERQRRALVDIVQGLARRQPTAKLWFNRGFEILPDVAVHVAGIVAESLFDGWDAARRRYVRVSSADRAWLQARLSEVRARHRRAVIVIDYRPELERAAARETAKRIAALGFEPWVCNATLTNLGIGRFEIMPRRVLVLTNSGPQRTAANADATPARWLAPVLEYLGYVPEVRDASAGLPALDLEGRYAGIISWFTTGMLAPDYPSWLVRQAQAGIPLAIFGALGFPPDSPLAHELGIRVAGEPGAHVLRGREGGVAERADAMIGFEAAAPQHRIEGHGVVLEGGGVHTHLARLDDYGQLATAIATTAWGGVALSHVLALRGLQGEVAWVIDPFEFLRRALRLPLLPVPDVTTDSGRRLALFMLDASGFAAHARSRGRPRVGALVRDRLLRPRLLPHGIAFGAGATPADRRWAPALLQLPAAYAAELSPGRTDVRERYRSLTHVQGMSDWDPAGPTVFAPTAGGAAFLTAESEAYPFAQVIQTWQLTDTPRRLKPLALSYPAAFAASPGGLATLRDLFTWLEAQQILPVRVAEYAQRVLAFGGQVVARALDGSFRFFGGAALRTVRVPAALGAPDLSRSTSVATARAMGDATYVSFGEGDRTLVLGESALDAPHIVQTNALVTRFQAQATARDLRIELKLSGIAQRPLELELAGLPAGASCTLELGKTQLVSETDASGTLRLQTSKPPASDARIRCALGTERAAVLDDGTSQSRRGVGRNVVAPGVASKPRSKFPQDAGSQEAPRAATLGQSMPASRSRDVQGTED